MAYTVHNFEQGDVLYAEQLNEMDEQIAANEENISNSVSFDMLAENYSANKTYSIGDYVIYNNELYTCIYEITAPEGWNSVHWRIANLGDGISDLTNALIQSEINVVRFESGTFNDPNGDAKYTPYPSRIRNISPLRTDDLYQITIPSGYQAWFFRYDESMKPLGAVGSWLTGIVILESILTESTHFINFAIKKTSAQTSDISADIPIVQSNTILVSTADHLKTFNNELTESSDVLVEETFTVVAQWNNRYDVSFNNGIRYRFSIESTSHSGVTGRLYFIKDGNPIYITDTITITAGDEYEVVCGETNVNGYGFKPSNVANIPTGYQFTLSITQLSYFETLFSLNNRIDELSDSYRKVINCFGDSITQGVSATASNYSYPSVLGTMLSSNIPVHNFGVSGATMANIAGRMCAIPVFLNEDIVFSVGQASATITTQNTFKSAYPSFESPRDSGIINRAGTPDFNPCYIDGHKCNITVSGDTLTITLVDETGNVTLHRGSQMYFKGGVDAANGFNIVMMGTNGTYTDADDYEAQYKKIADYCSNGKYLFLSQFDVAYTADGTYQTYKAAQIGGLERLKANEQKMRNAFGNRFVNLREQLVLHGLEYAINGGLLTSSALTATNNVDAIANDIVPFGDNFDGTTLSNLHNGLIFNIHPNNAGYYAIAKIVYNALVGLGYVD